MDINSHVQHDERTSVITVSTLKMFLIDTTHIAFCIHINSSKWDIVGKVHPAKAEMSHCCSHKTIKEIG